MMKSPQVLAGIFHKIGLRVTPQRRYIFNLLSKDESHPTVEELYQKTKVDMPDISRATIYNTVRALVDLGQLHEVEELGSNYKRYDPKIESHDHLYCVGCHRIIDIELEEDPTSLPQGDINGFKIQRSQVTHYGICQDCQSKEE